MIYTRTEPRRRRRGGSPIDSLTFE
jgi:hypothetical protein